MSALPITVAATLEPVSCFRCGTWFGIDAQLRREFLADQRDFYCPNGHAQHYIGKTEAQKLKEQLEAAQRNAEWYQRRAIANDQRAKHHERSARTYRGHLTRVRKRVGNGVCPCCNRTFGNLQRHMASEHPAYAQLVEGAPGKLRP